MIAQGDTRVSKRTPQTMTHCLPRALLDGCAEEQRADNFSLRFPPFSVDSRTPLRLPLGTGGGKGAQRPQQATAALTESRK